MKKLNKKGFTLVELLAVLVILIAITSIAIPTINSALERSKNKQNEQRKRIIESAAELYVSEHKNTFNKTCIKVETLKNEGYLDEESIKDADGRLFDGVVDVNIDRGEYTYNATKDKTNCF